MLGQPVGERLGLETGSRVLVRRAVRYTQPGGEDLAWTADSLADEYYPYDVVRDTPLASPAPANAAEILGELGYVVRGQVDELRPRLATTEERRLLSLPQVSVVLELARTVQDRAGKPLLMLHQVRRGDGAAFQYEISHPGK